jgi:hypothetical protein
MLGRESSQFPGIKANRLAFASARIIKVSYKKNKIHTFVLAGETAAAV